MFPPRMFRQSHCGGWMFNWLAAFISSNRPWVFSRSALVALTFMERVTWPRPMMRREPRRAMMLMTTRSSMRVKARRGPGGGGMEDGRPGVSEVEPWKMEDGKGEDGFTGAAPGPRWNYSQC